MTDFTITITDQDILDGITWKREQDNLNPNRDPIKTDQEFVSIECVHMLKQYARQKVEKDASDQAAAALKAFDDKMASKGQK